MAKKTRRVAKARRALLTLSLVLVVAMVSVGGTIAWLTSVTKPVVNTFTNSKVEITLQETGTVLSNNVYNKEFKMVPGATLDKNPTVTVKGGSEKCYVFVEIAEANNLANFIEYGIAEGWTLVQGQQNVYWREAAASETDQTFNVIKSKADSTGVVNKVTVKDSVDSDAMKGLSASNYPTLTFKAYAIQKDYLTTDTPAAAWALVKEYDN